MRRVALTLALLATMLLAWERTLARASERERRLSSRVGRIVPEAERLELPIAALRLETPEGSWLYGRLAGSWRPLNVHRAPADAAAIQALIDGLTRAEGVIVTQAVEEAEAYGINTPTTVRVSLCGPGVLDEAGGDVRVAFDVGRGTGGEQPRTFVRRRGTPAIWAVEGDPLAPLRARDEGDPLPPLLERGAIPRDWPGWQSGLERLFVDRPDGTSTELERGALEPDPEALRRGEPPWTWILDPESDGREAARIPALAYTLFLETLPYAAVLDPARRAELVPEDGATVVTLVPYEGDVLELRLGPPLAGGGVPLWVSASGALLVLSQEVVALLAPAASLLAPGSAGNPWDPWLRGSAEPPR